MLHVIMMRLYTSQSVMVAGMSLLLLSVLVLTEAQTPGLNPQTPQPQPKKPLSNAEMARLMDEIMGRMDFRVRPNVEGDATVIECGLYIMSFGSISSDSMDYSMDVMLRQIWYDERLAYSNTSRPIVISASLIKNMWTPDVFFPTGKKAAFHDVTVPNRLMRLYPDGKVVYSIRLTLTLACPMNLKSFPMDHQECDFLMESYATETDDLVLQWLDDNDPVEFPEEIELPQFDLIAVTPTRCDDKTYKTGSFSCIRAQFSLQRQYGFFILQTYVPSILIVIISWVSFWINMDAVPARISLGVTTVLTMATQLSGSKGSIPRISYPKAIDIWMSVCMMFVFGALIEYAFINAMSRKEKKKGSGEGEEEEREPRNEEEQTLRHSLRACVSQRQTAKMVDKICRYLFPLAFLVFNLVYWPYFTHPST